MRSRPGAAGCWTGLHRRTGPLSFSLLAVSLVLAFVPAPTDAKERREPLAIDSGHPAERDAGAWAMPGGAQATRSDTLQFGFVGSDGFAILDETWTWDHGGPDPLEGWYATDLTVDLRAYFRRITAEIWTNGDGGGPTLNEVPAPILRGSGSLWLGAFESEADSLCWHDGLGYGNYWCQRAASPVLTWDGASPIDLNFVHFHDTEPLFDYAYVILRRTADGEERVLNDPGFSGQQGLAADHPSSPPTGTTYAVQLDAGFLSPGADFQVVFEFVSDAGWSDQDGSYETEYGPWGVDDVELSGGLLGGDVAYAFESGLDGWTVAPCAGTGSFFGVAALSSYMLEDACECRLSGNVLELHDDTREHPDGQHEVLRSNPVNVLRDVLPNLSGPGAGLAILAEFDQYAVLPRVNGVFYRMGWDYYPWECPIGHGPQWSGFVTYPYQFYYEGDRPCSTERDWAMSAGVPEDVEQLRFAYELYASCDAFGIPPDVCTNETNFTPLLDNVRMLFTRTPHAPAIAFGPGTRYQDTYSVYDVFDPARYGRADVALNLNFGDTSPWVRGDSLFVSGPLPTAGTRWEARLWFRLARVGPGAKPPHYNSWKAALADGRDITGGEFTSAWMDSAQSGTLTAKNRFVSYLRETGEDDYNPGAGELSDANEIIRDDVLVAGTEVEYFVTANYTATPGECFLLPDTTGGNFAAFEILPRWRLDGEVFKFPCLLVVSGDPAAAPAIAGALASLGIEHDRYDYLDAASNWKAPMVRDGLDEGGVPLLQLLEYRAVLVSSGSLGASAFWPEDFAMFDDWLTAFYAESNEHRQGLVLNGDNMGEILTARAPAFAYSTLGITLTAGRYSDWSGDDGPCVGVELPSGGGSFGTEHSAGDYSVRAWGNGCPEQFGFDVLGAAPTAVGNRSFYSSPAGAETAFAQITRRVDTQPQGFYRTVVDGVSYHHLTDGGTGDCATDSAAIVAAAANELRSALEWIFGVEDIPSLCEEVAPGTAAAPSERTPELGLLPSGPTPFRAETSLRFALSAESHVRLVIFDASGRRIRVLVDESRPAGVHEVRWDGRDGAGRLLPAGVYWSQLGAGGHQFSRKLVVLQ